MILEKDISRWPSDIKRLYATWVMSIVILVVVAFIIIYADDSIDWALFWIPLVYTMGVSTTREHHKIFTFGGQLAMFMPVLLLSMVGETYTPSSLTVAASLLFMSTCYFLFSMEIVVVQTLAMILAMCVPDFYSDKMFFYFLVCYLICLCGSVVKI